MTLTTTEALSIDPAPSMGKGVDDIIAAYTQRRSERAGGIEKMRELGEHYDGNIPVLLPELDRQEKSAVANLLAVGVDQFGARVASVMPDVSYPPTRLGSQPALDRARTRRRATLGWFEVNELDVKMSRRARWLITWAQAPVVILPDRKTGQPSWHVRSPLGCYPADMADPDGMTPDDCIFSYLRSADWVRNRYGNVIPTGPDVDAKMVEIVEYIDDNEIVLLATGEAHRNTIYQAEYGVLGAQIINIGEHGNRRWVAQLNRVPNRAGVCTAVVPGRITLGGPKGQFNDMLPLFQQQAKLQAMQVNAAARGIWPDDWLVHKGEGRIITVADGVRGVLGEVVNGEISRQQTNPGALTQQTIDILERNQRVSVGLISEFGGESGSNIRTGKRGDAVMAAAIDMPIQEAQKVFARSLKHEIERAQAVDVAYFGNRKKSFFVTWPGGKGRVDYRPRELWGEDRTVMVSYASPGSDANQLSVIVGQAVGEGLMSRLTGRRILPYIEDAEFEEGQVVAEGIEAALLNSLQQQAAQGAIPPNDLARIASLMQTGDRSLADVVQQVHEEAQQRQASNGPPGTPTGPAEPGSPDAQPGLAQPGQGAEVPPVPQPTQGLQNNANLLRLLRRGVVPGQQSVAQSAPAAGP